ncbi:MAG TPA: hypothetical protein VN643_23385 [Pyrinomonadaceae bacterium]|nr:hypothetical protein [Pyrinomonadaceae bacterium]
MNTITILPNEDEGKLDSFSAMTLDYKAVGRTAGEALDALTSKTHTKISEPIIIQQFQPDRFFSEAQRGRLTELMSQWRQARDADTELSPVEMAELERLVDEEMLGAAKRSESVLTQVESFSDLSVDQNKSKFEYLMFFVGLALTLLLPWVVYSAFGGRTIIAILAPISGGLGVAIALLSYSRQMKTMRRDLHLILNQQRRLAQRLLRSEELSNSHQE